MEIILPILLIILNYFAGSISSAILIAKWVKKVDIRKIGHKKAGGSNVMQFIGIQWGILVGAFDILKGVPVLILAKYLNVEEIWLPFIAIASVCGHNWPIWFNFSGGRGFATIVGTIIYINPQLALYPVIIMALSFLPSIIKLKANIDLKLISSPVLTLLGLFVYAYLALQTSEVYDEIYAAMLIFVVLLRRVTARIDEYKDHDKFKLFISRLIFDNSEAIKSSL